MAGPFDPSEGGGAPPDGAEPFAARPSRPSRRHDRKKRKKHRAGMRRTSPPGARKRRGRLRGSGRRESRRHLIFAAAGLFAVLVTSALLLVFGFARLHGPGTTAVELDWPPGLGPEEAAQLLADHGLVRSASGMALYLRTTGGTSGFVPGEHLLPRDASPHDLREMLLRSPSRPTVRVVVPEGMHRFDIALRLHKQHVSGQEAFLAATSDRALLADLGITTTLNTLIASREHPDRTADPPDSAEGYLFPATYELQVDTPAHEIVRRLVAESDRRWAQLVEKHGARLAAVQASLGWGRREIVTLASIIQREAMVDDERPLIASVFMNRLTDPDFKPRRRLQSDPTAMYGCVAHPAEAPTCADYRGKPTSAILHDPKNRYGTYMAPGLPPGPISNPGVASLEAALSPATTRYYFFVAKGGGRHAFSETFGAHNDAIRARGD